MGSEDAARLSWVGAMSLCDTCRDPGVCCRGMSLNIVYPPEMTRKEVAEHTHAGTNPYSEKKSEPLPSFNPIRPSGRYISRGQRKPDSVRWLYSCTNLDEETGRCNDYENRPKLCRDFEPASNPLCVHYDGPWAGYLRLYKEKVKAVVAPAPDKEKV